MLAPSQHTNAVTVDDAGSRELPDGWAKTTLGETSLINPRFFTEPVEDDRVLTFLPMAAVEAGTGRIDLSQTRLFADVRKGYTKFSEGDVLFAKITPSMENGKVAVAKGLTNNCGCGSTEFHVLRPHKGISGDFLLFFLLQDAFRGEAQGHMAGTAGQLRVPAGFLEEADFMLPPLPEQHRIVAEIEKHFTRLDASVAALKTVQANLKRYRASVLKAACEGKLVPTEAELAQAEGRDYEPADRLLERIMAERRARWESQEKRRGKYKEPSAHDTSALPELPDGWVWATLPQLGELNRGKSKHRPRNDPRLLGGPYPFVQTGDIRHSQGLVTCHSQTYTEYGLAQSRLWPSGTLCITIAANIAETGILSYPACFPDSVVGFVCDNDPVITKFIEFFIRTEREGLERFAPATAQKNINLKVLSDLVVSLPPLAEQHRIVAEVERRLSVIQQAESAVEASLTRAERLRQSILKQAFSGNFVPQDPNDEPASVLLERIRAERAEAEAAAKSQRKPRRRGSKSTRTARPKLSEAAR